VAADWDAAVDFTLTQTAEGADVLDICLVSPDRDELHHAEQFYSRISLRKHPPLMIDSLNPEVMELALRVCGGGNFLNSASLQDRSHLQRVCELAEHSGSAFVVACRDEAGLAITRERKLNVALKTLDCVDVDPESVIVDVLALPVVTFPDGRGEAIAAIELIRHALPGVRTLLALSNFSFGMPPRERDAVERAILQDAVSAGVDFVILNTSRWSADVSRGRVG
jgi:5-methyltetrahydrofolate--homocysteine methyltransferase